MCTRLLQKSVPSESCDLNFIVEQFYCFHSFSVLEVKQALRASDLGHSLKVNSEGNQAQKTVRGSEVCGHGQLHNCWTSVSSSVQWE